jgi:uncharacterized LabA/DUF88 family protein
MTITRGKTICFIDDQNVFHGQRDNGWRIDWQKFIEFLSQNDEEIWQVYYFGSEKENQSDGEIGYFQFLKDEMRWVCELK